MSAANTLYAIFHMTYEIWRILVSFFLYEIPPIPVISSSIPNLSQLPSRDRYLGGVVAPTDHN